jgi:hypothetical protein
MKPIIVMTGLLLVIAGCDWMVGGERDLERELLHLEAEIVAAIGDARATDIAECRVIAYGAKPCGGPSRGRVYSEVDGDPERVRFLSAEVTRLEHQANIRYGRISDCAVVAPPMPALEGGQCVAASYHP